MKNNADEEKDINDVFSDILLSEEHLLKEGYHEGFKKGTSEDNIEGFHLGYHRGAELGSELGYYLGIVEIYLQSPSDRTEKIIKQLEQVRYLIHKFPKYNDTKVDILSLIENIRANFKRVCALLKINAQFPESDQLSF